MYEIHTMDIYINVKTTAVLNNFDNILFIQMILNSITIRKDRNANVI